MAISWFIAAKFLREYRAQTALTVAAVGVGVAVMVFLSALIDGLQESLVTRTLGAQAHIVVRPLEERARPLREEPGVVRRVDQPAQRVHSIGQWQRIDRQIRADASVVATAPAVTGDAFAFRGNASRPVAVIGTSSERFDEVLALSRGLRRGRYRFKGSEALVGAALADDLGVAVGDKVRLQTSRDRETLVTIVGTFDLGAKAVNERWVVLPLRAGQALLDLPGGANTIYAKVEEVFGAEIVARRIAGQTGLTAESWMAANAQLLVALQSQSSSSLTIQFFVFLAVAMGIASVLVVSVVQRTREIGILRAMGLGRRHIAGVFVMQGGLVGLVGSVVGVTFGAALSAGFARAVENPDGSAVFPMALTPELMLIAASLATVTGVLAAVLPAQRAARLDPAEAIRVI